MTYSKSSLTPEENMKLVNLKLQLLNTDCDQARSSLLQEIEQLLNKAKQRYKFLTTLEDEKNVEKQDPR